MQRRVRITLWLQWVLMATLGLLGGCYSGIPQRAVPEVDSYYLDLSELSGERSKSEIVDVLGEQPAIHKNSIGWEEWAYPIRTSGFSHERALPASVLKISFDSEGRVTAWGFYHPITDEPLPIRESLEQAQIWLNRCENPEGIELASLLKTGVSTKEEVLEQLGNKMFDAVPWFQPSFPNEGQVLRFYVDRPSPLYIPLTS